MKKTVPSPPRRKRGTTNTSNKKAAPTPNLSDIKEQMRQEAEVLTQSLAPKRKPKVRDMPAGDKQTAERTRREDLEAREPNPEMVKLYESVKTKARYKKELALIPAAIREAHEKKPLYGHQLITLGFYRENDRILDFGDPGVGKTRCALQAFAERRRKGGGKALVICPKTLMEPAWGNDAAEFVTDMNVSIAFVNKRAAAFSYDADIYVLNTDGVKWLISEGKKYLKGFDTIIIDELTAFKHRGSARSAAMRKLVKYFQFRSGLTGTPNSRSVTDLWHQVFLIDDGARLGNNYSRFEVAVCDKAQYGWVDKENSEVAVSGLLQDICVRHRFEDCMDIPRNHIYIVNYRPSEKLLTKYQEMEAYTLLQVESKLVTAVNAGVLRNKLLQIASGAVYGSIDEENDGQGKPSFILDTGRTELALDLIQEQEHPCVISFNWGHQKEQVMSLANKRGMKYAVLDRTTPDKRRTELIADFQAGLLEFILLHPKTGAHGITLTRGRRTIMLSPFDEADYAKQLIHRVYRGGQQHKTDTLMIAAMGTLEAEVYDNRNRKDGKMRSFLEMCEFTGDEEFNDE